jgi:hypothetical protein
MDLNNKTDRKETEKKELYYFIGVVHESINDIRDICDNTDSVIYKSLNTLITYMNTKIHELHKIHE